MDDATNATSTMESDLFGPPEENVTTTEKPTDAPKSAPKQAKADAKTQPEGDQAETLEDRIKRLETELVSERKRREDKDRFIGKQGDQIGKAKKALVSFATQELGITEEDVVKNFKTTLADLMISDPEKALELRDLKRAATEEERRVGEEKNIGEYREECKKWIGEKVQTFDKLIPGMSEIATADGAPDEFLEVLKDDPYRLPADNLYHLAKRAEEREARMAAEKKVADLEKRMGSIPSRIKAAANAAPASSKAGSASEPMMDDDDTDLFFTDDESFKRKTEHKRNIPPSAYEV